MHPPTSPRLPGTPILRIDATGPEFARWRRGVKFTLETKDTWKYCDGTFPMPMPEARPVSSYSTISSKKIEIIHPSLLDERRAWVRQDREVKLDIFLSLSEEVMQEVFEVGPPLPPSKCTAQEMLEALDEHFDVFDFQAYHHAFCHFLNLHIDQYTSIIDFNREFAAVLEDLLDYGHPLSNTQACSAYFSKLRCTQNPWVAKKLEEWHAYSSDPEIHDLMQESPPWTSIRPLATKSLQTFHVESTPEESPEGSSRYSKSDAVPEFSDASTVSSKTSHSRQISSSTTHSQEIYVHASNEAITGPSPKALREALEKLPTVVVVPERLMATAYTPTITESATPEWLSTKRSVAQVPLSASMERPLPSLPSQAQEKPDTEMRARSASPRLPVTMLMNSSRVSLTVPRPTSARPRTADPAFSPITSFAPLQLETTHPTLRPRSPTSAPTPPLLSDHPAFRVSPSASTEHLAVEVTTPITRPSTATTPTVPSTAPFPTVVTSSSKPPVSRLPTTEFNPPHPHSFKTSTPSHNSNSNSNNDNDTYPSPPSSQNSSTLSLPLQGTHTPTPTPANPNHTHSSQHNTILLSLHKPTNPHTPTFDSFLSTTPPRHRKSTSLTFLARMSGDGVVGAGDEVSGRADARAKGWGFVGRFRGGKGGAWI
ncbi:hypothetical protein BDW02DRAFT_573408 [Decorospora gaudefroyi]|uniref:Uncharacterized protein n=1 Tax=Decorospora gaudefroyi TaxID=184978 RepID=A0A6A5K199_9PLEO|nr:hypothetical protein BDW02DRAFT_573408 [Decorospora gaudefroyi]